MHTRKKSKNKHTTNEINTSSQYCLINDFKYRPTACFFYLKVLQTTVHLYFQNKMRYRTCKLNVLKKTGLWEKIFPTIYVKAMIHVTNQRPHAS